MSNNLKSKFIVFFQYSKSIANKCRYFCLNQLRKFKAVIKKYVKKESIESYIHWTKNIFWIFSTFIIFITAYQIIVESRTKSVYINLVNLPLSELNNGRTQESVTENLTITLHNIINSEETNIFGDLNQLLKKYKMSNLSCYSPYTSASNREKSNQGLHYEILKKIHFASDNEVISIARVSNYLRKFFDISSIELLPSIISLGERKYKAQVFAKYNNNFSHKSELEANSIQEAEDKLALLILKYSNPIIYASSIFAVNPDEAKQSISLLLKYDKELKKDSSSYTQLGNLYLDSNNDSNNLNISRHYFKKALEINDDDRSAQIGLIVANISELDKNQFKLDYKNLYKNDLSILDDIIKSDYLVDQAYAYKFIIYIVNNEASNANEIMNDDIYGLKNNTFLQIINLQNLLHQKKFPEAESLIETYLKKFEKVNLENLKKNNYLDYSFYSTLILCKLKLLILTDRLNEIQTPSTLTDECTKVFWLDFLTKEYASKKIDVDMKLERMINLEFLSAERNGVDGYSFYAMWGNFLLRSNQNEKSVNKFTKALEFAGDKSITYFKIANIYQKLGMFKISEEYALKSINEKLIPNAISIYFDSIFQQKNYTKFVEELWIRKKTIPAKELLDIQILAAFSECYLGNSVEVDNYLNIFKESSDKLSSTQLQQINFLQQQCK